MSAYRVGLLNLIAASLRPSVIHLIFVTEWALFVLLELLRGELVAGEALPAALLPVVFFYLVASLIIALSRRYVRLAEGVKLILFALSLTLLDQIIKTAVSVNLPYQASQPLIEGWLHLAHKRNLVGSWLVETFNLHYVTIPVLAVFTVAFLLAALVYHGRYIARYRASVWADMAFLGFFAALLSWMLDMLLRGYILDYLQIPGIVTADLKDVLLTISIAAIFAEVYDNPDLSLVRCQP